MSSLELPCKICGAEFAKQEELDEHNGTAWHRLNIVKYLLAKQKDELVLDKKGIVVGCQEKLDCIPQLNLSCIPDTTKEVNLFIQNQEDSIVFEQCEFLHKMPCRCSVTDEHGVSAGLKSVRIPKGHKYFVNIRLTPTGVGIFNSPLVFVFTMKSKERIYIVRYIELSCNDSITDSLQPIEPYVGVNKYLGLPEAVTIFRGERRKQMMAKPEYVNPLLNIKISNEMTYAIEEMQEMQRCFRNQRGLRNVKNKFGKELLLMLNYGLNAKVYSVYLLCLLNMEKIQMDYDIRKYDMLNATMTLGNFKKELQLRVPGLSENRPSVLLGDKIYVRIVDEKRCRKDIEYEGVVNHIDECCIQLGFHRELMSKFIIGMRFDVRFNYNTFPLKSMHRALTDLNKDTKKIIFPNLEMAATCPNLVDPTSRFIFFNRKIESNPEQAVAIKHIVAGSSLPAPYLLHGPPGTGKTVTIVEAIKQLHKLFPKKARILVCTPSNSASDLITERLLEHVQGYVMMRYYSVSRQWKDVPQKIKDQKCSNYDHQSESFTFPSYENLANFSIIISTVVNITRLVSMGFPIGHFTHLFIDEVGHAIEPELLIPISGLLKSRLPHDEGFGGQLVLAGDHLQLEPVIRCKVAEKFGLGVSLLERLMHVDVYQKVNGRFNPQVITRLLQNYRSHPDILQIPNKLFYENELKTCADQLARESLCNWMGLPKPGFPVLFHGVIGKDVQEAKSPSYFNAEEVSVVIKYIEQLLATRQVPIKQAEIGVITPYRQQVVKIRQQLRNKRFDGIRVGSVDEFQGQERRVIVISTVRSNPNLMDYDQKFRLGFVKNPRRFNVAVTRAKCLLIIIGNPKLLSLDKHWNEMLMFCWLQGSYVGVFYDPPEQEMEDMAQRLLKLGLLPTSKELNIEPDVKISKTAQQEDPQWRDEF